MIPAGARCRPGARTIVVILVLSACSPQRYATIIDRSQERQPRPAEPAKRGAPPSRSAVAQHWTEGRRLFQQRDFTAAANEFTAALRLSPENARLYVARGWALANAGAYAAAYRDFSTALRHEDLVEAYIGIAELSKATLQQAQTRSQVMSAYNSAEASYRTAIRMRPDDPQLHYGMATSIYLYFTHPRAYGWSRKSSLDYAVNSLRSAIRLKPDFAEAYLLQALLMLEQRNGLGAAAAADRALQLQPGNPEAHYVRGLIASRTSARHRAPDYARKALQLDPGNAKYARAVQEWQRPAPLTAGETFAALVGLILLGAFLADSDGGGGSYASSGPTHDPWPRFMNDWANDLIMDVK